MTEEAEHPFVLLRQGIAPADAMCLAQGRTINRQSILDCLQVQFQFPAYFGQNFDAAYDLLLDVVDTLEEPTLWRFCTGSLPEIHEDALDCWQHLMQDLMHYAREKGARLQVELFLESESP